jgi:hypothetical protein
MVNTEQLAWFQGKNEVQLSTVLSVGCTLYAMPDYIIATGKRIGAKKDWRSSDPRWWLEGGSRQDELRKSNILLRCWSHTWQKKPPRRSKTPRPWTPSLYKVSPYHVTLRKQEGFCATRCQFQTCLGEADQQVNKQATRGIPIATPGINQQTDWCPTWTDRWPAPHTHTKKKLINKQGTEKHMQQRGCGALSTPRREEGQIAELCMNFQ